MKKIVTAAFAIIAIAAATQANAAYVRSAPYHHGYGSYARAHGSNLTYYNSYLADQAYGYDTFANRPTDNASMNKRHLEGWE